MKYKWREREELVKNVQYAASLQRRAYAHCNAERATSSCCGTIEVLAVVCFAADDMRQLVDTP